MRGKKIGCVVVVAVMMSSLLFGCGEKEKAEENIPVTEEVIEGVNGTKEEIPIEEAEDKTQDQSEDEGEQVKQDPENGEPENADPANANPANVESEKPKTEKPKTGETKPETVDGAEAKAIKNSAGAGEESLMGDVFGNIVSLNADSFTIEQAIVSDDQTTMVLNRENATRVTVFAKAETVYKIFEIRNGGVNGNEDLTILDASASDLKVGDSLGLTGTWNGEEYHVTQVNIFKQL